MKSRINRDEREISISELWWYVISKWKWLVIGMVVGALLMGAFGAYKAYSANNAENSKEIAMEDLTEEEQEEVKALIEDYEFYQAEVERLENNYLMNLNYTDVYRCLFSYYIDTDYSYNYLDVQEDYATELVSVYKTYVGSDEVRHKIMELNIEGLDEIDLNYIISTSNEGNILRVVVYGNEEGYTSISEVIKTAIEEYQSIASEYIGEHKLVAISSDTIKAYSEIIKNRQRMQEEYLKCLSDELVATETIMSEKQVLVYENSIADNDETSSDITSEITTSLVNKKYIVVGTLGGMSIVVVIVIVTFMAGKKIKSVSELNQVYGVDVLGKILKDGRSCRYAIKNINKINTDETETIQKKYITETILNKCKQNSITKIAFCSTVSGLTEEFSDAIKVLNDAGIDSKCVTNINCDSEALNVAVKSRNVIIVEQLNVTTKNNISAEIETCDKLSINIVGLILVI